MKYLQQRKPLGMLQPDGKTVLIEREFGDDIERLLAPDSTASVAITKLVALVGTQAGLIADLTRRVKALEDEYAL